MKKMFIIILLIINLFVVSSCYQRPELQETGFNKDRQKIRAIAARNKSKTYNINEPIVFDLYFGYEKEKCNIYKTFDDTFEIEFYALYFGPYNYIERFQQIPTISNKDKVYEPIIDHKLIPGFIREISLEEFDSEEYYVNIPERGKKTFNHSEEITIPREYIESYGDLLYLYIVQISYNEDVGYAMTEFLKLKFYIWYIDTDNFRLEFSLY